jgi:hypothetical protein
MYLVIYHRANILEIHVVLENQNPSMDPLYATW